MGQGFRQERLRPPIHGWHIVRCPNYVAQEQMLFRPDARRYEAGTVNLASLVGLQSALEMLIEVGIENIAAELLRKRGWLALALQTNGCHVLQADAPSANAGGTITFHRPGADLRTLHQKLLEANIVRSLRADRSGQRYLRLSPHFHNTDAELS